MSKIFLSGINGIGMSGLAKILKNMGHDIKGSDIENKKTTKELEDLGIEVFIGQKVENIENFKPDLYIYSTAIKETNPEYIYAVSNNIEMQKRGQALANISNKFSKSIAIAGTHGKTTTSSMMGVCFLQKDPYIMVGGIIPEIDNNYKVGSSEYFITEADESDNSFLYLNPNYSIITNIEEDHLEHHKNFDNIKNSFMQFINQTKEKVIISKDCPNIRKMDLTQYEEKIVYYSVNDENCDIFASDIKISLGKTVFNVNIKGINLGQFALSIPGIHNVKNSLPVIYMAYMQKLDMQEVKKALLEFKGAKRRYQIIYDNEIKVIDDYAHHPTEIKATIDAARLNENGKIVVIFEPHRYTRTKFFLNEFASSLVLADEIILLPIYSANEKNDFNISSQDLCDKIKQIDENKKVSVMLPEVVMEYIYSKEEKNVYIFMGAGTVSKFAYNLVNKMKGM